MWNCLICIVYKDAWLNTGCKENCRSINLFTLYEDKRLFFIIQNCWWEIILKKAFFIITYCFKVPSIREALRIIVKYFNVFQKKNSSEAKDINCIVSTEINLRISYRCHSKEELYKV